MTEIEQQEKRRFRWRKMTWTVLIWTIVFGLWIGWGLADSASSNATDCGTLSQQTCNAASDVGTGIAVVGLFFVWFIGFIILMIIWFASRPKEKHVVYIHQAPPTEPTP